MKNLKFAAALLLIMALLCSLAACGGETQPEATDAEAETTENGLLSGLDIGTVDGNTYMNETLALRCELGDDWYVYSEDELAALMGIVADNFSDSIIGDAVKNNQSVTVFVAMDTTTGASINIAVSNNEMPTLSEEGLIALMVPQMKPLLEQSGFADVTCSQAEVEFVGQTHTGIDITGSVQGVTVYERQVYLLVDSYLYVVTATAYEENGAQPVLDIFTAMN